ncbi:MAG: ABC transporter ATP-binding protein [Clostridiales Family XIII bacterium]|jgi:ABC-2 type transport system ATP-binding protein|nr:ABC transporter ATP-binding protein [Clostridiales Family XIII bacterium]
MIVINGLTKTFDDVIALENFNMTVKKGSIYGLIGTNGAGKTTLLKLLSGVLKADSGTIRIDDEVVYENPAIKERLSFIPDDLQFFAVYTLNEISKYFARIYDKWNDALFDEIIAEFHLDKKKKLSRFSKGMQKQAVFAVSLATSPDFLILDEPIDGLDPLVRKTVWSYIISASAERQMTTLISSHNLREMEGICDAVGIIDKGEMILEKELDELRGDIHKLQLSFEGAPATDSQLESIYRHLHVVHRDKRGAVDIFIVRNNRETLDEWKNLYHPILFDPIPLTLEEVFIYELGGTNHAINSIIS